MPTSIPSQHETEKRQLRVAIARSRRRIDRRVRNSRRAAGRLTSWRTYAQRWPFATVAAGLGLGWILAAGLRPRVLVGLLGSRVIRRMSGRVTDLLVDELKRFWSDTAPRAERTNAEGGEDA